MASFSTCPCHFQPKASIIYLSLFYLTISLQRNMLFSRFKILNSSEYISYQLTSLEWEITVEHDENVGRSTCNLDSLDRIISSFYSWKMYAFTLSQNNLYCDLCFIIYILEILYFWQFIPVSDRLFFFLERRKAHIFIFVFTLALLVVSLSYHTRCSYLSINIFCALTAALLAYHHIIVWLGAKEHTRKRKRITWKWLEMS